MKPKTDTRKLLGLTQQEMALMLNVSRSQISLYELGKRDLPPDAAVHIAEMLEHMEQKKLTDKSTPATVSQNKVMTKELEKMLRENEYRTMRISQKLSIIEKKHKKNSRARLLDEYPIQGQNGKAVVKHIVQKASPTTTENTMDLFRLKLKLELLTLEKSLLEAEIKKLL